MQEYFHPVKSLPGRENVRFPNLIKGNWNVERPLEIVVSDMTRAAKKTWQLVLMIDVFNNEIIRSLILSVQINLTTIVLKNLKI